MISTLLSLFIWLWSIILFHELGHYVTARRLGYKAKLNFFSCDVHGDISPEHDYLISAVGLIAGFLPVYLASTIFIAPLSLSILALYLAGTRKDLVRVLKGYDK